MALKDKAALVDLSNIGSTQATRGLGGKTAIGMHADALFRDEKVAAENSDLKLRLAEFDGASATKKIDPKKIHPSKWANRHESSFGTAEFDSLKREIESSGGNIQPIKVRPLAGQVGEYELIFGHRRHRACLELGIDVLALVEPMDDIELFCQMDRENRERSALRPYEAGVTYAKALDEGLFPSARKLAESASIDLSQLGKALSLARLPADVVMAFESPLDLQYRWASELTQALQKDPDLVLARAKEMRELKTKPSAGAVLKHLVEGGGTVPPPSKKVVIKGKDGQTANVMFKPEIKSVEIKVGNIDPAKFAQLEKSIRALVS